MKLKVILTPLILSFFFIKSFAANGCRVNGRVFITTTSQCSACPNNREPWTNGPNYIIFSDAATECNSAPYNNVGVQYVKVGQVATRTNAFANTSCYTTDGSGYTLGTSVSYVRFYNCPLDDYIWMLILPLCAFGLCIVRKRNLLILMELSSTKTRL